MDNTPRYQRILTFLDEYGSSTITNLSLILHVSHMSIRRDLKSLQEKGLVKVLYGGEVKRNFLSGTPLYDLKQTRFAENKKVIGELAYQLLVPGSVIFLDGGTTTREFAMTINMPLTVITLDLCIAMELNDKPEVTVIFCPGEIKSKTRASYNTETVRYLSGHVIDMAFIGADCFSLEDGALTTSQEKADCKWMAISRAIQSALLVDTSKLNLRSRFKITELNQFDYIITEQPLPTPFQTQLHSSEVTLITNKTT